MAGYNIAAQRHGHSWLVPPSVWPDDGLPLGVQVIAAPWREDLALRVARHLEREGVARAPVARL